METFVSVCLTDQIEKYLMKEKSEAAVKIQTHWRGHRERSQLARRQQIAQQVKAAIKIQRAVSGCNDTVRYKINTGQCKQWVGVTIQLDTKLIQDNVSSEWVLQYS